MKLRGLDVYGIRRIVISGTASSMWVRVPVLSPGKTDSDDVTQYIWTKKIHISKDVLPQKLESAMLKFVRYALDTPSKYDVWVHTDTINIRVKGDD